MCPMLLSFLLLFHDISRFFFRFWVPCHFRRRQINIRTTHLIEQNRPDPLHQSVDRSVKYWRRYPTLKSPCHYRSLKVKVRAADF